MEDKKIDPAEMQIAASKILADGEAYFKLFEKHVPRDLGAAAEVLLYKIGNMTCMLELIALNPAASYVIVGNEAASNALKVMLPEATEVKYLKELDFKETDMKFDCIVMNPPYQRNLHLKILAEAIKHLKDEKSVCVNLSPVRWLQDPLAKYKKNCDLKRFEESVAKHIESLDLITSDDACSLFNTTRINIQLGIYVAKSVKTNFDYNRLALNPILDKVITNMLDNMTKHIVYGKPMKYACVVTLITGGANGATESVSHWMLEKDKAYFHNDKNSAGQTYKEYRDTKIWGNLKPKAEVTHIEFENESERENFHNYCETTFFRYIFKTSVVDVNVHPDFLPWLGDVINPRTGLKGYTGEWTDEDLYKFFNITPEEQKTIEETMAKYK